MRPTEVEAFLKYILWLAVVCAIGTIWQYRFHYDVFYDLADKRLPGFFRSASRPTASTTFGRYMTQGPAEHPLEAAAMMSMALPIALVGIIRNEDARAAGSCTAWPPASCSARRSRPTARAR